MKRCTRCILPASKPDLYFDEEGVCSACRSHEKRSLIDWKEREARLEELLDRHGRRCIVASSGGKDSHFIAIDLVRRGVDVTCVTAVTCDPTPMAWKNIKNLGSWAEAVLSMPNRAVRRSLNRTGLRLVGDISWPEHVAIFTQPVRWAKALGHTLIFFGENPQEAYGGPPGADEAAEMTRRWISEFGGFLGLRPDDIDLPDMDYYRMPADTGGIEAHFHGHYVRWDSHRNASVATEHGFDWIMPCDRNWWPWENLDNYQTGIHDYMMWLKYGFGRATSQLSVDIRDGLSREEGLAEALDRENRPPDSYMGKTTDLILADIGVEEGEFWEICDKFHAKDSSDPDAPRQAEAGL